MEMNQRLQHRDASRVGFGGASISGEGGGYGFGAISENDAVALLHAALDRGINIFDTAPVYGFGTSERRMGIAFKDRREKVMLVSKCGVTWAENHRIRMDNDPEIARRMLEQSLRDLQTDYIDLYMIHWPDARVDIREPMKVLSEAKKAGKILSIGLCNTTVEEIERASEVDRIDVIQCEYNFFNRQAEKELFPLCREKQIGFMAWGTFDKGILSGRATPTRKYDEHDARSWAPWWKKHDRESKFRVMAKLAPELAALGVSPVELALASTLRHLVVTTALCGFRSLEQLNTAIDAMRVLEDPIRLAAILEKCDAILD